MATLTASPDLALAPGSLASFELHLLCGWGAIAPHPDDECTCARLVRIEGVDDAGSHLEVFVLEPGADITAIDAAVALVDELHGLLVSAGPAVWDLALLQC